MCKKPSTTILKNEKTQISYKLLLFEGALNVGETKSNGGDEGGDAHLMLLYTTLLVQLVLQWLTVSPIIFCALRASVLYSKGSQKVTV